MSPPERTLVDHSRQTEASIRVFSNESTLRMRWPKYWSFSFGIIPFKEIPELIVLSWCTRESYAY